VNAIDFDSCSEFSLRNRRLCVRNSHPECPFAVSYLDQHVLSITENVYSRVRHRTIFVCHDTLEKHEPNKGIQNATEMLVWPGLSASTVIRRFSNNCRAFASVRNHATDGGTLYSTVFPGGTSA